ncbi:protein RKD1 [Elaeis guineensis]|uniref:Protein RKD4 n=1 Tax=Elaeis guineensis var. tenera TaxID=51953 RepID=A0A6I9QQ73_ELAGV|nr:protein RKD4 [Elaeis guineensis]
MDFNLMNGLMIVEEKDSLDWALLGDPLPDVPLLSEMDALVPFPESLDQNNDLHGSHPFSNNLAAVVPYQPHSPPPLAQMAWDDIDKFTPIHYGDAISDVGPLDIITRSNDVYDGKNNYSDPFEAFRVGCVDERSTEERTNGRPRLTAIGFDEIRNYFHMPITRAAKEMNVGLTLLKRRCRELGIPRWPHRKIKSLRALIHNVQELGKGPNRESIRRELETLEEHRRLMEENPLIELTEGTKKLRQACFKAHFKKRRALQKHCFDLSNKYYA